MIVVISLVVEKQSGKKYQNHYAYRGKKIAARAVITRSNYYLLCLFLFHSYNVLCAAMIANFSGTMVKIPVFGS